MRILMPSITDPAAARSGAGTVTRNLIRMLEAPRLSATVRCVPIPRTTAGAHRVRQARAIARALVSALPAKAAYTYSAGFRHAVLQHLNGQRWDVVMINGSDLLWLHPLLPPAIPRILVAHNIEHLLFATQAARAGVSCPALRPMLEREVRRMERFEVDGMTGTRNVVFLSSDDRARALGSTGGLHCIVTPPVFGDGAGRGTTSSRAGDRLELGFLGNLHWWPNRDALSWFLTRVFPRLTREVHLHLYGEGASDAVARNPRITRHGAVGDLATVWSQCDLMLCPMRSGGGVSIKLAESVYHGMPTLTTSFATRGLPLVDDPGLIVRDGDDAWIDYLNGADAVDLRRRRIDDALSSRFARGAHQDELHAFVRRVVAGR